MLFSSWTEITGHFCHVFFLFSLLKFTFLFFSFLSHTTMHTQNARILGIFDQCKLALLWNVSLHSLSLCLLALIRLLFLKQPVTCFTWWKNDAPKHTQIRTFNFIQFGQHWISFGVVDWESGIGNVEIVVFLSLRVTFESFVVVCVARI